jgi:hypothetical protein
MQFGTGLNGSVLGSMYGGQGQPAAAGSAGAPAATAGPTGRTSLMAAAWGTTDGGSSSKAGTVAAIVGAASWIALIGIYWALPR